MSNETRGRPKTIKGETVAFAVILPTSDYQKLEAIRNSEREAGDRSSSLGRLIREGVKLLLKKHKL